MKVLEKLYNVELGKLVSSFESVAFNRNKRRNLLDSHYTYQKFRLEDEREELKKPSLKDLR